MDRYEYKLKFDEIKSLMNEQKYESAVQIADTVNWRKVSNMSALMLAAEVYEQADRFDESIDLLLLAYDRSPIGKKIVYKLAEIAVKTGNLDAAMDYYREFVEIAPHDTDKYLLALEISRAKGEPETSQIRILEELKDQEYTEEWTYELAYLYHKAGEVAKCVDTCDELVLWFGDGDYVEKALELKLLYQPLTPEQEAKYKSLREKKDGIKELVAPEQIDVSGYDTVNLQEEIAKGMRQIIDATEKDQVSKSIGNIKKLVDDIPYLSRVVDEYQLPPKNDIYVESDEEIDGRIRVNFEEILKEESDGQISLSVPYRAASAEEEQIKGQMDIEDVLAEWERTKAAAEEALQIAEAEKLEAAKQRAIIEAGDIVDKLAGIMPDAINAGEILDKVKESAPQETDIALADTQELTDINRVLARARDAIDDEIDQVERDLREEMAAEARERNASAPAEEDDPLEAKMTENIAAWEQIKRDMESADETEALRQQIERELGVEVTTSDLTGEEPQTTADDTKDAAETAQEASQPTQAQPSLEDAPQEDAQEQAATAPASAEEAQAAEDAQEQAAAAPATAEEAQTPEGAQPSPADAQPVPAAPQQTRASADAQASQPEQAQPQPSPERTDLTRTREIGPVRPETTPLPQLDLSPEIFEHKERPRRKRQNRKTTVSQTTASLMAGGITELDDDLRGIFTYFLNVEGIEQQIIQVLDGAGKALLYRDNASTGNVVITGISGSGKTTLGTDIAKALHAIIKRPGKRVGKISAEALGKKSIADIVSKISSGCLIIEKADGMTKETAEKLAEYLPTVTDETLFILEGTSPAIKRIFAGNKKLESMFTEKVIIPNFSTDELVSFARTYASENGYSIDELAVLALYRRIGNVEKVGKATSLLQVKDIMDEAFSRVEKGSIKKAFGILTSRRYDKDNYVIIREKDLG